MSEGTRPAVLVRADGDAVVGAGHLMRCLALAQAFRARGFETSFLGRCGQEAIRRRFAAEGFAWRPIEVVHPDPGDLRTALERLASVRHGSSPSWLVIDGYPFDEGYQRAVREAGFRTLVVDDTVRLPRYHADILLNQNLDAEHLSYPGDPGMVRLLGVRYAMLRSEFLARPREAERAMRPARRVLVTLGGGDAGRALDRVLEGLGRVRGSGLEATVLAGASGDEEVFATKLRAVPFPVRWLRHVSDAAAVMAEADVAVTAGGSTCWEAAYLGLPALVVVLSDDQRGIAEALDRQGVVRNLGPGERLEPGVLAESLDRLLADGALRAAMAERGRALVDGGGAARVAAVVEAITAGSPPDAPVVPRA